MRPPSQQQAAHEIIDVLPDLFGCTIKSIRVREMAPSDGYDFCIDVPGHRLLVEYKVKDAGGSVQKAITTIQQIAQAHAGNGLPLLVVPYLGPLGQSLCKQAGISWFDFCGNAHIVAPGLLIHVAGCPNKFRERGRPTNIFASKSSRVARQLLSEPDRFQAQAEIARGTGLGDGFVSKIVRRLETEHYLELNQAGAVRPLDPNLLLAAWRAAYQFSRHRNLTGRVSGDSGQEILRKTAGQLSKAKIEHAATGLAAAWLLTGFAPFSLASIYIRSSMPPRSVLEKIGFEEQGQGGNLWLVVPDDEAVFQDSRQLKGFRCVSPLQAVLDLNDQQGGGEAAAALSSKFLNWRPKKK